MYKGTKITLRAKLYEAKQKADQKAVNGRCRGAVLRNFATCEICRLRIFATLQNFHSLLSLLHFFSKSTLIRSCNFEFGSGSSCLNLIEDNEVLDLQDYNNRATKCDH